MLVFLGFSKWEGLEFFKVFLSEKDQKTRAEGIVTETLPDTTFRVRLTDDREVLAYLSGKMRLHYIKVMLGDKVTLELSPDGKRGRIVFRN